MTLRKARTPAGPKKVKTAARRATGRRIKLTRKAK
jgi:hypothetical protein